MSMPSLTHYQSLGVSPATSFDEIKKAYKKLSLKYHPDKTPLQAHHEKFKEITTAYEIIRAHHENKVSNNYQETSSTASSTTNYHASSQYYSYTSTKNYASSGESHSRHWEQGSSTSGSARGNPYTTGQHQQWSQSQSQSSSTYSYYHFFQKSQEQKRQAAKAAAAQAERLQQEMYERVQAEAKLRKKESQRQKQKQKQKDEGMAKKTDELQKTQGKTSQTRKESLLRQDQNGSEGTRSSNKKPNMPDLEPETDSLSSSSSEPDPAPALARDVPSETNPDKDCDNGYNAAKEARRSKIEAAEIANEFLRRAHGLYSEDPENLQQHSNKRDFSSGSEDKFKRKQQKVEKNAKRGIRQETKQLPSALHKSRKNFDRLDDQKFPILETPNHFVEDNEAQGNMELDADVDADLHGDVVVVVDVDVDVSRDKENIVPLNSHFESGYKLNETGKINKLSQGDDIPETTRIDLTNLSDDSHDEYVPFNVKTRQPPPRASAVSTSRKPIDQSKTSSKLQPPKLILPLPLPLPLLLPLQLLQLYRQTQPNQHPQISPLSKPAKSPSMLAHKRQKFTVSDTPSAFDMENLGENLGREFEDVDIHELRESLPIERDHDKGEGHNNNNNNNNNNYMNDDDDHDHDNINDIGRRKVHNKVNAHRKLQPLEIEFVYSNGRSQPETLSTPINKTTVRGHTPVSPGTKRQKLNELDLHASPEVQNLMAPKPPMANFDPTTITKSKWQRYVASMLDYQRSFLAYKQLIVQYQYERTGKDAQFFELINDISSGLTNLNTYNMCIRQDLEVMQQYETALRVFLQTMNLYAQNCHWIGIYKKNDLNWT